MQPNIIYFVADQLRADALHHLGNEASQTPNLDALASEGISYANAYCQNPVCVPSRCSFLTGLYPHTTGHRTIHYLQNEEEPNLMKTMKEQGYEVVWAGRNDVVAANHSFEAYCDVYFNGIDRENHRADRSKKQPAKHPSTPNLSPSIKDTSVPGYYSHYLGKLSETQAHQANWAGNDWAILDAVFDYLDHRQSDRPLFLYISLLFPHPPYGCEDPWYSQIDRSLIAEPRPSALELDKPSMLKGIAEKQQLNEWGKENLRELRAVYLAMVSRFDYQFGLLRRKLIDRGLYDSSNIFVFSDHGDYTGDYQIVEKVQNCFEDPVSRVPLLIKPAAGMPVTPRISQALVELTDLTATVEELTGIQSDYVHFGKSLVPTFAQEQEHHDAVFCEGGRIHGEIWAMERGHNADSPYWPRLSTQESEGPEHTKAVMIRKGQFKYIKRLYERDELYDLKLDPLELVNRIDDPDYAGIVSSLKERMLDWMIETGDIVPNRKDPRY